MSKAEAFTRVCAILTCAGLLLAAGTARAEDSPAPGSVSAARASVDQAIEHQKSRRSLGIAGMVAGGVAIIGGTVVSEVAFEQNHRDRNNGEPATHNDYVGYAVGYGAGLPLLGIGGYIFADAQHQLNLLRSQRVSLGLTPDGRRPGLQLSFSY